MVSCGWPGFRRPNPVLSDVAEVPDLSASRDNSDLAEDDPCDPTTTSKPEAPMQSLITKIVSCAQSKNEQEKDASNLIYYSRVEFWIHEDSADLRVFKSS
jgi:hypothetical protein